MMTKKEEREEKKRKIIAKQGKRRRERRILTVTAAYALFTKTSSCPFCSVLIVSKRALTCSSTE